MPRRRNLRGLLQKALWLKVIIVFSIVLLLAADFTNLAHAGFSCLVADTILTVPVDYPHADGLVGSDPATVQGTAKQVVLRIGNNLLPSDFPLLFPMDMPCPTIIFTDSNKISPMPKDFVYAIKVLYQGTPNAPLDTIQVGTGGASSMTSKITSIGYCQDQYQDQGGPHQGVPPSTNNGSRLLPHAIDFLFGPSPYPLINPKQESAILFYTSPDPPDPVPTVIKGSGIGSQGVFQGTMSNANTVQSPIFGPAPAIDIVKQAFCIDPSGQSVKVNKGDIVAKGVPLVYQFTVTNERVTDDLVNHPKNLTNVVITDPVLNFTKQLSSSCPDGSPSCIPAHLPSASPNSVTVEDKITASKGTTTNIAHVEADYIITDQNGNPIGIVNISADSTPVEVTVDDTGLCAMPVKCDTICFRPPALCQIFFDKLPAGTILISGVNNNNPINIQTNGTLIRNALIPCPISFCTLTPVQYFNQQFVAAQLALAAVGGPSSAAGINALWSNLRCYSTLANFQPVQLSNGVILTPNSMLKDLFEQARKVITENRTAADRASDMTKLADLLKLLNSTCTKL